MSRRRIGWAVCFAMLLVAAGWVAYSTREPSYRGKSLTEWLSLYWKQEGVMWGRTGKLRDRNETPDESLMAIRKIGTNALPQLVSMVGAKDSPMRIKIETLLGRQSVIRIHFRAATENRVLGMWGFVALGAEAKPAVPALIRLTEDKDIMVRSMAMLCLGKIGPEAKAAVPVLIRGLNDPNPKMRSMALYALRSVHEPGDEVVPTLIKKLEAPRRDPSVDYPSIIYVLGEFGPDAKAAVPTLLSIVREESGASRTAAAEALMRIEPDVAKLMLPEEVKEKEEISSWPKRDW